MVSCFISVEVHFKMQHPRLITIVMFSKEVRLKKSYNTNEAWLIFLLNDRADWADVESVCHIVDIFFMSPLLEW